MAKIKQNWKLPAFDRFCPSPIDWARMAAFIDGEGTILINPRRGRQTQYDSLAATFYLKVSISNTDLNLMDWLKLTFGGNYHFKDNQRYYRDRNVKDAYAWSVSSSQAAWILYNCLPYFIIKYEQASIGIQLQESMGRFTRGPGKSLPPEIVEERRNLKKNLLILKARGRTLEPEQDKRIQEVS